MIFDRLGTLQAFFGSLSGPSRPAVQGAIRAQARLWSAAFAAVPALRDDLIRQGGLLRPQPVTMIEGEPQPGPFDPYRLAYEAGRRDLALQLLAAGGLTPTDLNLMMKDQDYGLENLD